MGDRRCVAPRGEGRRRDRRVRRSTRACRHDRARGSVRGRSGWRRRRWGPPTRGRSSCRPAVRDLTVVDAGDAPVVPTRFERSLRVIHEKVFRVAERGPIPIVLGGDHSITYPERGRGRAARAGRGTVGIVHFDAHADTGADQWGNLHGHGTPMRRLIEEGRVAGRNFVQVGLRGYWPDKETFEWMREQGMRGTR